MWVVYSVSEGQARQPSLPYPCRPLPPLDFSRCCLFLWLGSASLSSCSPISPSQPCDFLTTSSPELQGLLLVHLKGLLSREVWKSDSTERLKKKINRGVWLLGLKEESQTFCSIASNFLLHEEEHYMHLLQRYQSLSTQNYSIRTRSIREETFQES